MKNFSKFISFLIFSSVVITILVYPILFKNIVGTSKHSLIVGLVFFACCAIVYALGFKPNNKFLQLLINPLVTLSSVTLLYMLIFF